MGEAGSEMRDRRPQRALEMSHRSDAYLDSTRTRGGGSIAIPVPDTCDGLRLDPISNQQSAGEDREAFVQISKSSKASLLLRQNTVNDVEQEVRKLICYDDRQNHMVPTVSSRWRGTGRRLDQT